MTAAKTELAVASREALGRELRDHDFESPAGVSLDVLIAPLMQGDLDANTARKICDDIERNYRFYGEEGPLRDAVSWIELRRRVCAPGPSEPRALLDG